MISLDDYTNLCLSGGAEGADVQWGMCAGLLGHAVVHWSFNGHKSTAPESEIVRLPQDLLDAADPCIEQAALWVKKHPPKQQFVKNLIQRNYYQVAWSDSVYAVTDIVDGVAQGGTAWAIYMYLSRGDILDKNCYVYDQTRGSWYAWNNDTPPWEDAWQEIDMPPQPSGIWAGIGTRDLKDNGKQAIRTLMDYVKPTL